MVIEVFSGVSIATLWSNFDQGKPASSSINGGPTVDEQFYWRARQVELYRNQAAWRTRSAPRRHSIISRSSYAVQSQPETVRAVGVCNMAWSPYIRPMSSRTIRLSDGTCEDIAKLLFCEE